MGITFKRNKVENFFEYVLAVFCVYLNGSWLFFEYGTPSKILLYVLLLGFLIYDAVTKKKIAFPNVVILVLAVLPILSKLFNISKDSDLVNTFSTVIIYLILGCYRKELLFSILGKVAEVIYFLCIVSIIFGLLFSINYSWLNLFPVHQNVAFTNGDINGYHNLIVYTDKFNNDYRTQSIFWEPGAWLYNEMFAFYWLLFVKKRSEVIWVFLVGILLTASTTGFILIAILGVQIWFFSKDSAVKKKFTVMILGITGATVVVSLYVAAKLDFNIGGFIYEMVVDKLFNPDSKTAMVSTTDRLNATLNAFKIAKENPFFGIGRQSPDNALFVTSSISEISYQLGFIYLAIFIYVFRTSFSKLNFFISIPFVLIMLNGEAYSPFILSSLIVIYGAKEGILGKLLSYKPKAQTDNIAIG